MYDDDAYQASAVRGKWRSWPSRAPLPLFPSWAAVAGSPPPQLPDDALESSFRKADDDLREVELHRVDVHDGRAEAKALLF
jgi:hypothetical protein